MNTLHTSAGLDASTTLLRTGIMALFGLFLSACSPQPETQSSLAAAPVEDAQSAKECSAPEWPLPEAPGGKALSPEEATQRIVASLRIRRIPDPEKWARWLVQAMQAKHYPLTPTKIALLLAIIKNESDFSADPNVQENIDALIELKLQEDFEKNPTDETLYNAIVEHTDVGRFLKKYRGLAKGAKTERDLASHLQAAISEFKRDFPDYAERLSEYKPGWELKLLSQVGTVGPTQVGILSSFDSTERASLTWQDYQNRQTELIENPEAAIEATIGYIQALQEVYGASYQKVIGDYKGGRWAALNASLQLAFGMPEAEVDGDLLRFDLRGLPLEEVSATELAARRFSAERELNLSDAQIRSDLSKTGKELTETCLARTARDHYMRTHGGYEPVPELLTHKGTASAKERETVEQYIGKVDAEYKAWVDLIGGSPAKTAVKANQQVPKQTAPKAATKTPKAKAPTPPPASTPDAFDAKLQAAWNADHLSCSSLKHTIDNPQRSTWSWNAPSLKVTLTISTEDTCTRASLSSVNPYGDDPGYYLITDPKTGVSYEHGECMPSELALLIPSTIFTKMCLPARK